MSRKNKIRDLWKHCFLTFMVSWRDKVNSWEIHIMLSLSMTLLSRDKVLNLDMPAGRWQCRSTSETLALEWVIVIRSRLVFVLIVIIEVDILFFYKLGTYLAIKVYYRIYFYRKYKCKMDDKLPNPFDVLNERLKKIENLLFTILLDSQKQLTNQNYKPGDKSIELAIAITGLKRKTIYNLAYKRLIPHSKRGKCLYFDEAELNEWIKKGKRKTLEELGLTR